MPLMKGIAIIAVCWLFLVALVAATLGTLPSSPTGWAVLIVLGPIGYLLASALGETGMQRLAALAERFRLGPSGRIALLLLILVPVFALFAYLTAIP